MICMHTLHVFFPSNHSFAVSILPSCLLENHFFQENFAKYSMVICCKLIFSWLWAQTKLHCESPACTKYHYNVNYFRMETKLSDLSMLQIKWTCYTATKWVKFLGAVLKSQFHLIQFSAASTCLASYQFTYITRIRHSFSQVNYTVFIPCNHEQAWLF